MHQNVRSKYRDEVLNPRLFVGAQNGTGTSIPPPSKCRI